MAYPDDYEAPFVPGRKLTIASIENDGVWLRGNTYKVTWYYHNWIIGEFVGENSNTFYRLAPLFLVTSGFTKNDEIPTPIFATNGAADGYIDNATTSASINSADFFEPDYNDMDMNTEITYSDSYGTLQGGARGDGNAFYLKYLVTSTFTVPANATIGTFILAYMGFLKDHNPSPDTIKEKLRSYFPITIIQEGGSGPANFPAERVSTYDPDQVWDPDGGGGIGGWTTPNALTTLGGGRYGQRLVVMNNKGNIFFGGL